MQIIFLIIGFCMTGMLERITQDSFEPVEIYWNGIIEHHRRGEVRSLADQISISMLCFALLRLGSIPREKYAHEKRKFTGKAIYTGPDPVYWFYFDSFSPVFFYFFVSAIFTLFLLWILWFHKQFFLSLVFILSFLVPILLFSLLKNACNNLKPRVNRLNY